MANTPNSPIPPMSSDPTGLGGIPGMGGATPNLLGELRSEVSTEAAPMLVWLGKHIKQIIAVFVLMVAIILGYGAWQWYSENVRQEAQLKLGRILVTQDPAARLAGLEAYLAEAPSDMKLGVQLEIAMTALAANDQNKAAQAYGAVRRSLPDSAMGIAAAMNEASLLLQLGKAADAVTVLAEIEEFIPELMKTQFDERKAFALEQAGRLADALAMYETLAGKSVNSDNDFFRYKVNVLKGKLGK